MEVDKVDLTQLEASSYQAGGYQGLNNLETSSVMQGSCSFS